MNRLILCLAILMGSAPASAEGFVWPNGAKAAVSLSYDDALDSQLNNAVPTLNKHDIKASFYLLLASPVLYARLDEWRALAKQGHEIGNHTIYHPCSASQPGNDWVRPHNDMDKRTVEHMRQEVFVANSFLKAIDGRTERTMTPPCGHLETSDGNYLPAVREFFVAIKGDEKVPAGFSIYSVPSDIRGEELIALVQRAAENGGMANIIFHGIGGDHLAVATQEHEKLIRFLAQHRDVYWTDTYLNIMKYVNAKMLKPPGGSE
jgi:peptidoglycan/xylan/chitin deacetylase (PgdA/CDA1 family)